MDTKPTKIIVCTHGFVFRGVPERVTDPLLGECIKVSSCENMRWQREGKGLGYIATNSDATNVQWDAYPDTLLALTHIMQVL